MHNLFTNTLLELEQLIGLISQHIYYFILHMLPTEQSQFLNAANICPELNSHLKTDVNHTEFYEK